MEPFLPLFRYARRHRAAWLLISALTLAGAGLAALQPWPMKILVDQVLTAREPALPLLTAVVLGGLLLFVLNTVLDALLAWTWTLTGRRMMYGLAEELFARLQRRSLLFHKRNSVADLMSRVAVDSWSAYQAIETLVFSPVQALLTCGAMIFLMAQLDGTLTWLAVGLAPLMVGASFLLGKPLRAAAKLKREIETRIQAHIQQTLTGIPVVQAFAQEEREQLRFQRFAEAAIRSQQRSALLGSVNSLSSGLITTLGSGLVLWLGARRVLDHSLSLGGILVFLVYLNSLQGQIKTLAKTFTSLQNLSASAQRVAEVLAEEAELPEKAQAPALPAVRGHIQFDQVTVGYQEDCPVLKEVCLEAHPGQTIALVGATGAGKTTLVSLLPRFLDPWNGRVLIDGQEVRQVRLQSLRAQIGLVLQESFLFPVSIRENIALGRPGASEAEIEAAARAANAHEFILACPEGYNTLIGERGATLSGGQRQRLAIARALLKDAPILILDEPTSALDAQTEHLLLEALQRLMRHRTTFVIAHRLSTIRQADAIVVLKDGRIAETGTHAQLLARNGHYARLHCRQVEPEQPALAATT